MEHSRKVCKNLIYHRQFGLILRQTCATREHIPPVLFDLLRATVPPIYDDTLAHRFSTVGALISNGLVADPSGLSRKGVLVKSYSQALVKR